MSSVVQDCRHSGLAAGKENRERHGRKPLQHLLPLLKLENRKRNACAIAAASAETEGEGDDFTFVFMTALLLHRITKAVSTTL